MRCFPALVVIAAAGCGGSDLTLPSQNVAAKIAVVKGDHQSAVIGSALADSLVVQVMDSRNQPVANQPVAFAVVGGGGSLAPTSTTTNPGGIAQARWTLGPSVGDQQATATVTGNGAPADLSVAFSATATAAAPAKIEAVAGNNQTSPAGSSVPTDPSVKVTDNRGNPIAGVSVTFAVTGGGGAINPTTPVSTSASGLASVSWTLGPQAGPNTLSASVAGSNVAGNPVTFTATGATGSAGKVVIVTQPPTTAQSGVPLSPAPSVQLQDANGNDVNQGGVSIQADIASGPPSASIGGASATTNNKGIATFGDLVLNGPAGQYTLSFNGNNLTGAISTPVTLGAGGATKLALLVPPSATAQSGAPFAQQPQIQLRDGSGNAVAQAGVSIVATLSDQPSGGGSLGGQKKVQTGADGVARFTDLSISGAEGTYQLLFASGNLASVTATVALTKGKTTTSLEADLTTPNPGQSVNLTATVRAVAPATGTPTGPVRFFDGNDEIGSDNLDGSGVAKIHPKFSAPGAHQLKAEYSGNNAFDGSVSNVVTITVVNRAPVAANDNYSTNEDTPLSVPAPGILGNDSDPDQDPITAVKLTDPAHGTLTFNGNGAFIYTPQANFFGPDAFTYAANDGTTNSSAATVTITVNPVNDPPSFTAGPSQVTTALQTVSVPGWATNISPGPNETTQTVSFVVTTDNDAAFLTTPAVDGAGTLTFQTSIFATTVNVTVVARDSEGAESAGQTFTITISP